MTKPTLNDFYTALLSSVKYYPRAAMLCKWPQTWRVLQLSFGSEVTTPNLGAIICDKDKPFFWSRKWHEAQYNPNAVTFNWPLLYAFERPGYIEDLLTGSPSWVYPIEIGVIDVLTDDIKGRKCQDCNARSVNEIYQDTQTILAGCLEYARNTRLYELDGSGTLAYLNDDYVARGLEYGSITSAAKKGPGILDASAHLNKQAQFFRIERTEKLYGTAVTLSVKLPQCETVGWNFEQTDYGTLAQDAGCKNC